MILILYLSYTYIYISTDLIYTHKHKLRVNEYDRFIYVIITINKWNGINEWMEWMTFIELN